MTAKPDNRLYVADRLETDTDLQLPEERAHYVGRVLRLRIGDALTVFNGSGGEFAAVVIGDSRRSVTLRIGAYRDRNAESPLQINLIQGVSRGERMDFVVQKATELGVHRITPLMTGFSVVRLAGDKREKRALHWTKVAQSACEQCGRNVVPLIDPPQTFTRWLETSATPPPVPDGVDRIVLKPGAPDALSSVKPVRSVIALLIGPEGGLNDAEYEQAAAAGFTACRLGPRILRTETAAIAALSFLQSRWGDLT